MFLVFVLFLKLSSWVCFVQSESDTGFLGSLDMKVKIFQNSRQD